MQSSVLSIGLIIALIAIIIVLLVIESIMHNRRLKTIPLRISVTGTRGKTSVTRILAAILRESGKSVLAKTTGTEAIYILPDGSEQNIKRFGAVNIIEQKKLVRKASKSGVECMISEVMSIHPENHRLESQKLLKPDYTIITNLRPDHLDAAPANEMWKLYANDIYPESTVIIPASELNDSLKQVIIEKKVNLITVDDTSHSIQNQHIASKLASILGCSDKHIQFGINSFRMDKGETLGYRFKNGSNEVIFINSFAANDPISSSLIIDEISSTKYWPGFSIIGLLSLRTDRGERSQQWLSFFKEGGAGRFEQLFCLGTHAGSFKRSLNNADIIRSTDPKEITEKIIESCNKSCLIFGLANIGGLGFKLAGYWEKEGEKINILNLNK